MLKLTLQILRYGINFVAVVVLLAVALASPEAVQAHYDVIPLVGDVRWLGGRWPQLLLCVWVAFLYGLSHGLARLVVRLGGGPWVRWFVELLRAVPGGWLTKVGWALFLSKEELVRTPLVYVVREAARGRQGPSVEAVVEAVVDTVKTTVETITGSWTPYLVGGAVAVTIIYVVIKILTGGGGGGAGGPTVGEVRHEAAAALQEAQPAVPQAVPEAVQEAAAAVAGGFGLYGVVRSGLSLLRTFFWGETPLPPVQEEPVVEQTVVEAQPVMEAQPLPVVEDVEDLVNMGRFYVFCGVIYEVIRQLRLQQLLDPLGLVAYLPPVRLGSLRSLRLWQPLVRLWRRPPGAKAQAPGQAVEQSPVQEDPVMEAQPIVEQPVVALTEAQRSALGQCLGESLALAREISPTFHRLLPFLEGSLAQCIRPGMTSVLELWAPLDEGVTFLDHLVEQWPLPVNKDLKRVILRNVVDSILFNVLERFERGQFMTSAQQMRQEVVDLLPPEAQELF